jgi:WD40 repeat protein
MFVHSIL